MDERKNQPSAPPSREPAEEKPNEPTKEIHHHHYHDRRPGFNFGRLAIGLILVFVGLVYLIQANGWLNIDISFDWWKLWPLIIIVIGLSMLGGRGWLSGTIGIVVLVAILVIVGLLIFSDNNTSVAVTEKPIAIAKEATATAGTVDIKAGAGKIYIDGTTDQLITGNFKSNVTTLATDSSIDGTMQTTTLKEESYHWQNFSHNVNDLTLQLNRDLPLRLSVDSGASELKLNLKDVWAESVDIDTGASSMTLEMGDKIATSTVSVNAGASSISISVPRTVGVKLVLDAGLSSKNLPDFKKIDEKNYESENYSTAEKKINMTLKMGVSSVTINWR